MIAKIHRIVWWVLFPPVGFWLTHRHKQRVKAEIEEQRHAELVAASQMKTI